MPRLEPFNPWSDREIAALLYGVLRFGEGQWKHIMEAIDFDKTDLASVFQPDRVLLKRSSL